MKQENLFTPNCIRTYTGLYMNVFEPAPEMICIEDIAHSLSMQPRFGGHLPIFYSVAQHSSRCANVANHKLISANDGGDKKAAFEALMHDASEAYLMDIPSPIKAGIPEYKVIEDKLMRVIAGKFGFNYPFSSITKQVDSEMLHKEWNLIMLGDRNEVHKYERSIQESRDYFLRLFEYFKPQ